MFLLFFLDACIRVVPSDAELTGVMGAGLGPVLRQALVRVRGLFRGAPYLLSW